MDGADPSPGCGEQPTAAAPQGSRRLDASRPQPAEAPTAPRDAPAPAPAPANTSTALPERVGPYRVESVLGRGGMGVVAGAVDERDGRRVALKFLLGALARDERELARVTREAGLLSDVAHPHVVRILAMEEHAGAPVVVMELVEGESLAAQLARGPLPVADALRTCAQAASALAAAHELGIVHRDLKPANVKLGADGGARVLDFGLACRTTSDVPRSLASEAADLDAEGGIGTAGYMSPEQILHEEPTTSADAWALGCLLFECLVGRPAFEGATVPERLRATLRGNVDLAALPDGTPPPVREILVRCLARDPRRRPASLAIVAAVLRGEADVSSLESPGEPTRARLPRTRSRFVGREEPVRRLLGLARESRLVTVTGAGGSGKTRLVLEAAGGIDGDDTVLVELAVVASPSLVAPQVALALSVADRAGGTTTDAVVDALRPRRLRLVLDNCEHVLDEARTLAARLLAECEGVRIVATSREPLRLEGEAVLALEPLGVPDPAHATSDVDLLARNDAVALFVDRARAARPAFRLDATTAADVARICRRLDGMPLALELAAARLRTLGVRELADAMEARVADLAGANPRALPRHQALRATIAWSVDRLDEHERQLHLSLAVLAAPFTVELAEAVADVPPGEVLPGLVRLTDKSLLQVQPDADTRWRMLEPIRQHALDVLERERLIAVSRRRLVRAVHRMVAEEQAALDGATVSAATARLALDHSHLVEALRLAPTCGEAVSGLESFLGLGNYWLTRGLWREGAALAAPLLADPACKASPVLGGALLVEGQLQLMLGELAACERRIDEASPLVRASGDERLVAECSNMASQIAWERRELDRARDLALEGLAIRRRLPNEEEVVNSLNMLGNIALHARDLEAAHEWLTQAITIQRRIGNPYVLSILSSNLSVVATDLGRVDEARAWLEEGLANARACGSRRGELFALANLANLDVRQGHHAEAAELHRAATAICRELADRPGAITIVFGTAFAALETSRPREGATLLGAAQALRDALGADRFHKQDLFDAFCARARAHLGDRDYERAFADGLALDFGGALDACDAFNRAPTS